MLLDIGMGILMVLFVSRIFALPVGAFMVIAGIIFSLIMDADAVIDLIVHRGAAESYKHRNLFHIPLIYIPMGMAVIYFFQSYQSLYPPLALPLLFGLCSLAHYIHDSIGIGWGVKWLYPFRDDQYSFFYQYNAHKAGLHPSKWGIYVWKSADIDLLEEKYGDRDWFKHIYLSLHPYALVETAIFLLSLILLYAGC